MGDMADWTLEQIEDDDYFSNIMYIEESDSYCGPFVGHKTFPTCRYCKQPNLRWGKVNERWFLYETPGKLHDCPNRPLSVEDLKEIAKFKTKKDMMPNIKFPFDKYIPPSWDELFFRHVYLIASKSKDYYTKIGGILVKNNRIISEGYNGICSNINDSIIERNERPEKYFWYEHAERNCIFSAARLGCSTENSILYTNSIPCADCTRAIIQSGIIEIIVHKQWMDHEYTFKRNKWDESTTRSKIMISESNLKFRIFNKILNINAFLDGVLICI